MKDSWEAETSTKNREAANPLQLTSKRKSDPDDWSVPLE
jgi:hypothetical protein